MENWKTSSFKRGETILNIELNLNFKHELKIIKLYKSWNAICLITP